MHSPSGTAISELDLLSWKREVFALYRRVRELEPEAAWGEWRAGRDRLFATHPQTPLGADALEEFELSGEQSLPLYWLEGYGGGLFLPFADLTSGRDSYGGGRYLLDTVKG